MSGPEPETFQFYFQPTRFQKIPITISIGFALGFGHEHDGSAGVQNLTPEMAAQARTALLNTRFRMSHTVTCIELKGWSYTRSSAQIVAGALSMPLSKVKKVTIEDVINGRLDEEGFAILRMLTAALSAAKNVEELSLQDTAVGVRGVETLIELISNFPALKSLNLYQTGLDGDSIDHVFHGLQDWIKMGGLRNLVYLNLGQNNLGAKGCLVLGEMLKSCTNLEELNCEGCRAGSIETAAILRGLLAAAEAKPGHPLRVLHFDCSLKVGGVQDQLNSDGFKDQLEDMGSQSDELAGLLDGDVYLERLISVTANLEVLSLLDSGWFSEQTARALAQSSCPLSVLRLTDCDLDEQYQHLLPILQGKASSLTHLDLSLNLLDDDAMKDVLHHLGQENGLLELKLEGCCLTNESFPLFLQGSLPNLRALDLSDNEELLRPRDVQPLLEGLGNVHLTFGLGGDNGENSDDDASDGYGDDSD